MIEMVINKRGENFFLLGNFDSFILDVVVKKLEKLLEIICIVFIVNGGFNDDSVIFKLGCFIW